MQERMFKEVLVKIGLDTQRDKSKMEIKKQ